MRKALITSKELAARLGRSQACLWQMVRRNALLRSCVIDETRSRLSWSVPRLIAAGFLFDDAAIPSSIPAPTQETADVG